MDPALKNSLKNIKIVAMDFDGTLTDGYVYFDQNGIETVRCSRKDTLFIKTLQNKGIHFVIISTETSQVVAARAQKMKVDYFHGVPGLGEQKLDILKKYVAEKGAKPEEVIYFGDDVNDVACMKFAKVAITVADGHDECKKIAKFVTKGRGGEHALREVCDLLMQV